MSTDRPATVEQGGSPSPIRILVADDHEIFRYCITVALRQQSDFEVVGEAECGPDAVREAERLCPDVVLMDVMMQGCADGIQAASDIRQKCPGARVIALSQYEDEPLKNSMRQAGAVAFVAKDWSMVDLLDAIRAAK